MSDTTLFRLSNTLVYDRFNQQLRLHQAQEAQHIALDNLESLVLNYLIDQGEVVSKEALLSIWPTKVVMEHSLARVISSLRKKLNDSAKSPTFIKTIPRQGYRYIGQYEPVTENTHALEDTDCTSPEEATVETADKVLNSKNVLFKSHILLTTVAVLTVALFFVGLDFNPFKPDDTSNEVTNSPTSTLVTSATGNTNTESGKPNLAQLNSNKINAVKSNYRYRVQVVHNDPLDEKLQKQGMAVNARGDKLAYIARQVGDKDWSLKVKSLMSGQVSNHVNPDGSIQVPTWLDNDTVAYQRFFNIEQRSVCVIEKVELGDNGQFGLVEKIADCSPHITTPAMVATREGNLILLEVEEQSGVINLVELNVLTANSSKINVDNAMLSGAYYLALSPNQKHLGILSANGWAETKITLVDREVPEQTLWSEHVAQVLYTIALSDDALTYINVFKSLTSYSISESQRYIIDTTFTNAVYSPIAINDDLLLFEGQLNSTNASLIDLSSGDISELTKLVGVDVSLAVPLSGGRFIYVANHAGINQIWLSSTRSPISRQLTQFAQNKHITALDANASLSLIAVSLPDGVELLQSHDGFEYDKTKLIKHAFSGAIAGKYLYYQLSADKKSGIYRYDLNQSSAELYVENGQAITFDKQLAYFTRTDMSGLWRKSTLGDEQLVTGSNHWPLTQHWAVTNGKLTMVDDDQLMEIDLSSQSKKVYQGVQCNSAIPWHQQYCLTYISQPKANRMIRLSKQKTY